MEGSKMLALVLLLAFAYSVIADNVTATFEDDDDNHLSGTEIDDGIEFNNVSAKENDLSESEKAKLLKLITTEAQPGWDKLAKQMAQEAIQKMKTQTSSSEGKDSPNGALEDSGPPAGLISSVTSKLSQFTDPLASRVKSSVTGLKTKWNSLTPDQKNRAKGTLTTIKDNVVKFGNAQDNPIGAIQGAINIVGAIASNFGPKGQLISMGLSFVSALLGLFGKGGKKPKPMAQIVREQIDEALAEYRDDELTSQAEGLITAFGGSKAYLDGLALTGKPLTEKDIEAAQRRVPMTQGSEFLGKLASVINRMFRDNKGKDGRKCIKYCELYAQMTAIRDMILTQFISMSSTDPELENDVNGLIGYREAFRLGTKVLFENLYAINFDSVIMPHFDPEVNEITHSYSTAMLDLGKSYNPSNAGMFCLMSSRSHDLVWDRKDGKFMPGGKPYATVFSRGNSNCYWKLVPHGNYIYSIVNKFNCKKGHEMCNWLLTYSDEGDKAYVKIDKDYGSLWEIWGYDYRRIRNKGGCGNSNSKWCNQELRIVERKRYAILPIWKYMNVGRLLPSDGKYYWRLRKV